MGKNVTNCPSYKSIFVTTNFALDTGSGNVSHHEAKALATITDVKKILTETDIKPKLPQLPDTARSFLWDYFAAHELARASPMEPGMSVKCTASLSIDK